MKRNQKYVFIDDPEPKEPIEDAEDRFIKKSSRIFNIVITVAFCAMAVMFICGLVIRYT